MYLWLQGGDDMGEFSTRYTHGDSYIELTSPGWSGNIIDATAESDDDRKFVYEVDFTLENGNWGTSWVRTDANSYGLVTRIRSTNHCVIGMSLEHFGDGWWDGRYCLQAIGRGVQSEGSVRKAAFGVAWNTGEEPVSLNVDDQSMNLQLYTYFSAYAQRAGVQSSVFQWISCDPNCNPIQQYIGWLVGTYKATISTDLPIFETDADLLAWCLDPTNPETLSKMLNYSEPITPEEQYELDKLTYFVHNIFRRKRTSSVTTYWRNYRWKPGYGSKIRFYKTTASENSPYNLVLVVPGGLTRYKGPKGQYLNDDSYEVDSDTLQTHYLNASATYYDEYEIPITWQVDDFDTNIPIFATHDQATDYANDLIGIEEAINYQDIRDYLQELPTPTFGDEDLLTETGVNGQNYANGSCFYALSTSQMNAFFAEVFSHPDVWSAFKDGTLLFGEESIDALFGCMFLPISDLSTIASLEGSAGDIYVGAWRSERAQGRKIIRNDKVISCGEFQMTDMFKDIRDYEPYTQIFVQLPYCGTHQLSIQKYLNKLVSVKYAVDVFTGGCTAMIFANGILLDSFDGLIGMQRPITGRTAGGLLSSIIGGGAMTAGAVAAGGKAIPSIAAGSEAAEAWGAMGAAGSYEGVYAGGTAVGAYTGGLNTVETMTMGGALRANAGAITAGLGGAAVGAGIALAGTYAAWKIKNAYDNPPMTTRGTYSSGLGFFANQKIHFIVAIRNTIRPENELELIGYPSGRSGKIGDFTGYLKCSTVYLADGFIGSSQERNEILQMLAKGIYI